MRLNRIGAVCGIVALLATAAPAEAKNVWYWSESAAERYLEKRYYVHDTGCAGYGKPYKGLHRKFYCVTSDDDSGERLDARLRVTSRKGAYVKWVAPPE